MIGSSIAREADNVFYTLAGPEIAVATTKAYSTQLIATYTLAIQFAKVRGQITEEQYTGYIEELKTLPDKISESLKTKNEFSGLHPNRRMQKTFSSSDVELIMQFQSGRQPEDERNQLYSF